VGDEARLRRLLASFVYLLVSGLVWAAAQPAQVQTGPVTEPRGTAHEAGPPIAKGAAAITEQHEKCSTRLIVNADALFQPHRWTLNHDASQTLDVLGPMIAKAGNYPARILVETHAAESDSENRDVSQRRALTVRTWLVNHHFVAEGTPMESAASKSTNTAQNETQSAESPRGPSRNGTVEVLIDSCH
jgi:outer membrane protein OmpA-like peptidoglycan-associated protein